jgi:hypothetical protein
MAKRRLCLSERRGKTCLEVKRTSIGDIGFAIFSSLTFTQLEPNNDAPNHLSVVATLISAFVHDLGYSRNRKGCPSRRHNHEALRIQGVSRVDQVDFDHEGHLNGASNDYTFILPSLLTRLMNPRRQVIYHTSSRSKATRWAAWRRCVRQPKLETCLTFSSSSKTMRGVISSEWTGWISSHSEK